MGGTPLKSDYKAARSRDWHLAPIWCIHKVVNAGLTYSAENIRRQPNRGSMSAIS